MKTLIPALTLSLAFVLVSFTGQVGIDEVISAIKSGNAGELSKFIDDNVEITLPDKSDSYSKSQATLILRDFFRNNGVKNFEVKHKGDGQSGQFCVGTLMTNSGNYRTTVFMRMKSNKQIVKELRFLSVD
jgi:Domain of unknown function (DUF4783)